MGDGPNLLTWPTRLSGESIRVHLSIPGDPRSKARPRLSRGGHTYTPPATKAAQAVVGWTIKAAYRQLVPDGSSAFGVRVIFFCQTYERRDLDNMLKLVLDACTGIVWDDDRQVEEIITQVIRGERLEPRTDLVIYRTGELQSPHMSCEQCGRRYKTYPSWTNGPTPRRYCSRICATTAQRTGMHLPCAQCGKPIYKTGLRAKPLQREGKGYRDYCSRECRQLATTEALVCVECQQPFRRPRSLHRFGRTYCSAICQAAYCRRERTKAALGTCQDCGGSTSKKTYLRCRACQITRMIAPKEP